MHRAVDSRSRWEFLFEWVALHIGTWGLARPAGVMGTLRLLSYTLVFCLGFAACAMVVTRLPPYQGLPVAAPGGASLAAYRAPTRTNMIRDRYEVADAVARVEPAVVNIDTLG